MRLGHGDNLDKIDVQRSALLTPSTLARVAAVPSVASAIGDVAFPLSVIGRGGAPLPTRGGAPAHGHGWPSAALTPYRLASGHVPTSLGEVVLDAGLARAGGLRVGDRVRIVDPEGAQTFSLVGVAIASSAQQKRQSSVFLTQARAHQLSGLRSGFNVIAVRAEPGVDARLRHRIADAVGGNAQVLDHRHAAAADAGDPRAFDRTQLVALLAASGGMTLAIAMFVLAGTIAFAVEGRRRQIALVRAIGATPGQVRRMLLLQTGLIGLVAGAAGCLAATVLFGPFVHALTSVGVAPDGFAVTPLWIPYAIATAAGVVVALLATVVAAPRALAVRPGETLVESSLPQRRLGIVRVVLGLVALGGITLVIVLSSSALSYATLAAFCFMIAVALLAPVVVGWPAALAGRTLLAGGGVGFLAGSALGGGASASAPRARRSRSWSHSRARRWSALRPRGTRPSGRPASVCTQPTYSSHGRAAGCRPRLRGPRPSCPGPTPRESSRPMSSCSIATSPTRATAGTRRDSTPPRPAVTLDLDVRAGSLQAVRGQGIAVSGTIADLGVRVGSVLNARLADATPAQLRVVAIYRRSNGIGDVVLPRDLALAHASAPLDTAVYVGDRHDRQVTGGLEAIVRSVPTAVLRSRAAYLGDVRAQDQENARSQWVVVALMILIAAMAAFNTGAMAATERRRELVLARLSGATRAQVAGALTLESLLTALTGIGIGIAVVFGRSPARVAIPRAGSS